MHTTGMWGRLVPLTAAIAIFVIVGGCTDDKQTGPRNELVRYDSHVATAWFDLFLNITKTEHLTPPVASRAFAYEGVTLYEAVVPGLSSHKSLVGQLKGLDSLPQPSQGLGYHWPTVANAALAAVARQLYATATTASLQSIDDLETSLAVEFATEAGTTVFDRSVTHGHALGEAIFDWAFEDGAFQNHNCAYAPPQGNGLWVPTPPQLAPAQEPCWGENRNFIFDIPTRCAPIPPPPFDDGNTKSPFYIEMLEVYNTVNALTITQRSIAEFWADGTNTITPPGHWISILNQLTTTNDWKLDVSCEAYAKLGLAEGESFISCWRAKYLYNFIRPITCIRNSLNPSWNPFIVTPPFPEYPSGHSVQSAAAAQVLTAMFGHMQFEDHTHDNDGTGMPPRTFADFFAAANEAKDSRLYGGIHFRSAIENGFQQGICIGEKVSALEFTR